MITVTPLFFSSLPEDISQIWNRLQKSSFSPKFQYDFEYMLAWSELLREDWKPFLLLVKDNDIIKGMFPLMFRDEKRKKILPFRRIRFLGATMTDFSVILASREGLKEVIGTALKWLFSGRLRWELLVLDDLVEGNPVADILLTWMEDNTIACNTTKGKYYFIDLDRPWEEIRHETSKKFVRQNTNLARNRISKAGNWKVLVDPKWETDRIIAEASPMHIERQKVLDRESFFSKRESREFLRRIIMHNKKTGLFRSYWLQFEDLYIAYIFGFEQDNVCYAWNMAFHPDYSHFFPSKLLLFEIIKDCHQRGLKEFNFMRGESDYKAKWTKHFRTNYRFIVKNTKTVYGKILSLLERVIK